VLLPVSLALLLGATLGVVALMSNAGAQTAELPAQVADQQDVALNANGQATVRFDHGDPVLGAGIDVCMDDAPIVSLQLAVTLTPGKPQPRTWSARFNNACSFLVTVYDASNKPITNATVRLGYIAMSKGGVVFGPASAGSSFRR
jgi:hypothetical protein